MTMKKIICLAIVLLLGGCTSAYYGAMEKVGVHKRDIMVDRVENARDSQAEAQEQFKSALEQFDSVVKLKETDLKKSYDQLNEEYEECRAAAENVSARIEKVEAVSEDLFDEWKAEIKEYSNKDLATASRKQLETTRDRYEEMISRMHKAEESMAPVLVIFHDNVLFLKHNLNAQAIGSLQNEFASLELEIDKLVVRMSEAIDASNEFIAGIKQ
jgi:transketolase